MTHGAASGESNQAGLQLEEQRIVGRHGEVGEFPHPQSHRVTFGFSLFAHLSPPGAFHQGVNEVLRQTPFAHPGQGNCDPRHHRAWLDGNNAVRGGAPEHGETAHRQFAAHPSMQIGHSAAKQVIQFDFLMMMNPPHGFGRFQQPGVQTEGFETNVDHGKHYVGGILGSIGGCEHESVTPRAERWRRTQLSDRVGIYTGANSKHCGHFLRRLCHVTS